MRNLARVSVAVLISMLSLSACANNSQSSSGGGGGGSDTSMMEPAIKDSGMSPGVVDQAIIRSGDLTLETGNVEKVFSDIKDSASKFDGRVESSNYQARVNGYGPSAYLTIRVPESKLDSAIEAFSELGKRTSLSLSTSDVTLQTVDLQAKIDALEESRTRLQKLLDGTTSTAELIAGEQAMATLRTELDGYKSQLDYLKNQVAESTLNIQIVDNDTSVTSGLKSFQEFLLQAARGFLNAFQNAFIFIVSAIPWVLVFGAVILLARIVARAIRRILGR